MMLSRALAIISAPLNKSLKEYSPSSIVYMTLGTVLFTKIALKIYDVSKHNDLDQVKSRSTDYAVLKALRLPIIGNKIRDYIDSEIHEALDSLKAEVDEYDRQHPDLPAKLPANGYTSEEILATFDSLPNKTSDYKKSGAVYVHIDKRLEKLLSEVSILTEYTNPMHEHWRFLNRLQGRVIDMTKSLFHAPQGTYGIITHGGTTSILEACKSYVLNARNVLGITNPEIIVPETAHPAFAKACEILNANLRIASVYPLTGQVDVEAMAKLINHNTCLLVGSAPSYPYGQFDDIRKIGDLGLKNNIPVHVDACLGGFLNIFAKHAGIELPHWDFKVPGVTSISADMHKYGYSPKGVSFVYFHPSCTSSPTYTNLTSSCGMYVTEGIDGSRSGQPIAEAYTVLMYYGGNTYITEAKKIFDVKKDLVHQLNQIEGIRIIHGAPHSVVGIQTDQSVNLSVVIDQFHKKGWSTNVVQSGKAFHFCLTSVHGNEPHFVPSFVEDMKAAVTYAKENPNAHVSSIIKAYGQLSTQFAPNYVKNLIGDFFIKIRTMGDDVPGFTRPRPVVKNT